MNAERSATRDLISAALGLGVALLSAWGMHDRIRLVDILALFAGGFAAGAGVVSAIGKHRARHSAPAE